MVKIYGTYIKRAADAMEKLAVGTLLVGLFQEKPVAIALGVLFLVISFALTERK